MVKRILSFFTAAYLGILLLVPLAPSAAASGSYIGSTTYWDQFLLTIVHSTSGIPFLGQGVQSIAGALGGGVCSGSEDALHHATALSDDNVYEDNTGMYSYGTCIYCGARFKVYSDDVAGAYGDYVDSIENSVVRKYSSLHGYVGTLYTGAISSLSDIKQVSRHEVNYSFDYLDPYTMVYRSFDKYDGHATLCVYFQVPVSGYYYILEPAGVKIKTASSGDSFEISCLSAGSSVWYPSSYKDYSRVDISSPNQYSKRIYFNSSSFYRIYFDTSFKSEPDVWTEYVLSLQLVPDNGYFTGSILGPEDTSSRPGSITGNYGIIGDDGQLTQLEDVTIVNEAGDTIYNPVTGTTSTITDWTYDYSDRSYELTLDTGETITVTYGDQNVTIQEGDTVYNVYYVVSGETEGPVETPGGESEECQHEYTSEVTREPTCTFAGVTTYTCSLCGDIYTESIPATGHSWAVKETVQTSYDEDGTLLQQGYTIYKCSVCGEEYKDETGTGPPSGGGSGSEEGGGILDKLGQLIGTVLGGIVKVLEAVAGKLLDALIALVEMIAEKLGAVVELVLSFFDEIPQLFAGFLSFLGAIFPFFPEEVTLLLTFGIAVVVFIGIIKALRR